MTSTPTPGEREALERLRYSLFDWHFLDIKRAASAEIDLPRLAFIGLASWIDTVARLYTGRSLDGFSAWRAFIRKYLPERMHDDVEVRRLYDGLRNKLSHEYGTHNVLLTNAKPGSHWTLIGTDLRILDLDALIDEFESAFESFYAELETDAELRARVLPAAQGLLAPVEVKVRIGQRTLAIAASATGPLVRDIRDVKPGT